MNAPYKRPTEEERLADLRRHRPWTFWLWPWSYAAHMERRFVEEEDAYNHESENAERDHWENYRLKRELESLKGEQTTDWNALLGPERENDWQINSQISGLPAPRRFSAILHRRDGTAERRRVWALITRSGSFDWYCYVEGEPLVIMSCWLTDIEPLSEPWEPDVPEGVRKKIMQWKWWGDPSPFEPPWERTKEYVEDTADADVPF